jgi:hypothetical protein
MIILYILKAGSNSRNGVFLSWISVFGVTKQNDTVSNTLCQMNKSTIPLLKRTQEYKHYLYSHYVSAFGWELGEKCLECTLKNFLWLILHIQIHSV